VYMFLHLYNDKKMKYQKLNDQAVEPQEERRGEPSPVAEDESEPDEEMSDGGGETELQQRTAGHIITDWDPMTGTLADYRVLQSEEEAFSGEEYFMGNPVSGYHRHYRPTTSERENPSFVNDAAPPSYMDVDDPMPPENFNDAAENPNNRSVLEPPPEDADWWDFENLFKYMKCEEEQRAGRVKEAGIFTLNQLKEFIRTRLASTYSRTYPDMAFDHIISLGADDRHDYGTFCKIVLMGEWDDNFDHYVDLYLEREVT
ncbi:unnamed protein product, partial [Durusdinium trenchii]